MTASIWFHKRPSLELLNSPKPTMVVHLGIVITEIGDDFLTATMPVDHRTHQPFGILHGGASVVLAESLGSMGAYLCVDPSLYNVVGLEINANHIRAVKSGYVTGTARPLHAGKSTQVWEIRIVDEAGKLVCISRITLAVLAKN
jgi:1,4-dihydroxy-2-naphthoyl-CoA hydrolase